MPSLSALPDDLRLMVLDAVAITGPTNPLNLIQASKAYFDSSQSYLANSAIKAAADAVLPARPELVRNAIQAHCSKNTMQLDLNVAKCDELNAWIVEDPIKDIWNTAFTGSRLEALKFLIQLRDEIETGVDQLRDLCHYLSKQPFHNGPNAAANTERNTTAVRCSILHGTPRDKLVEAFWLQESIRLRKKNRVGSLAGSSPTSLVRASRARLQSPFFSQLISSSKAARDAHEARQRRSHLYYRYLKRVGEVYTKKCIRLTQHVLSTSRKFETGSWRYLQVMVLCGRWEWEVEFRHHGDLETDWDMRTPMLSVKYADLEFDEFRAFGCLME